ncbi:anti-sigma factor family protein [Pseudomonas sp. NPDC088444]|uniref:anti-sigma factor family protein n=1 Tax=Pseudomonas sp. NPDC088444 TaxID=3364456 RepID=UPI00384D602D
MITMPPSERDMHAYVDGQLSPIDRQTMEIYLASNPDLAREISDWQLDAQNLRAGVSGALRLPMNPELDPSVIRQRLRGRRHRHLATAAGLVIAIGVGGLGGWQARDVSLASRTLPMADAVQAYRMFATNDTMASDWNTAKPTNVQGWLDKNIAQASRLPNLESVGFKPVSGRLSTTEQGAAAMVVYKDTEGRVLSFYIRPQIDGNRVLQRGSRRDGELQADYWSEGGYNYAMIGPADDPAAKAARLTL